MSSRGRTADGALPLGLEINTAANEFVNCVADGVSYFARNGDIWAGRVDDR